MAETYEIIELVIPFEGQRDPADGIKQVLLQIAKESRRLKGARLREVKLYFERPVNPQGVEHGR